MAQITAQVTKISPAGPTPRHGPLIAEISSLLHQNIITCIFMLAVTAVPLVTSNSATSERAEACHEFQQRKHFIGKRHEMHASHVKTG
jgi:hypothetical protein